MDNPALLVDEDYGLIILRLESSLFFSDYDSPCSYQGTKVVIDGILKFY